MFGAVDGGGRELVAASHLEQQRPQAKTWPLPNGESADFSTLVICIFILYCILDFYRQDS